MPILIGTNTALPSRTTNTPSISLRVCPGFSSDAWTVGRRGRRPPGRRLLHDLPLVVVHELADRRRLDRHATAPVRVAVVMSAVHVKPGRTSGILAVDRHATLKLVACVAAAPVAWIGLLPISVTLRGERLVRQRVDRDLGRLAELHVRDVGLVDLDLGLDDRHVGERQQHGAGVVHRADHRRLALLDVAAGDDAVDRRLDADLAQVVPGVLERRLLLLDARRCVVTSAPALASVGLRMPHVVLGPLERLPSSSARPCQRSCWRARFLRLLERRLRALERTPQLLERDSARAERRLRRSRPACAGCADRSAAGTVPS